MKRCLRVKCQKEFEPKKPKAKFCSDKCRVYHSRESAKLIGDISISSKVEIEDDTAAVKTKLNEAVENVHPKGLRSKNKIPKSESNVAAEKKKAEPKKRETNEEFWKRRMEEKLGIK